MACNPLVFAACFLGLALVSGVVACVPLFAEAVSTQVLRRELATPDPNRTIPRASLLFTFAPTRASQPLVGERYRQVDEFLGGSVGPLSTLDATLVARYARTEPYTLLLEPRGEVGPSLQDTAEGRAGPRPKEGEAFLAFLDGLDQHVDVLEGRLPAPGQVAEAAISTEMLDELGLTMGEQVAIVVPQSSGNARTDVRIVGRWAPRDQSEPYWFNQPSYYRNALIVTESVLDEFVNRFPRAAREYAWFYTFDPMALRASDAERVTTGLAELRAAGDQALRGLRLDVSPEDLLAGYRQRIFFLEVLLFVLSAPMLTIALLFITSTASTLVDRQQGEIAVLKSRGATSRQIVAMYGVEWGLLGLLATPLGLILAVLLTLAIGQTDAFLSFGGQMPLPVQVTPQAIVYAIVAALLGASAALLPAIGAAQHSIVTHLREAARSLGPGFVQRYYLDLLPLPAAAYAYYLLLQRRSVLPVGKAGDAFSDPLLLLAPAMAIIACALLYARLFPLVAAILHRLAAPFPGAVFLIAARQMARQPRGYAGLVLLLTLTMALGGFSAIIAATLDHNYDDAAAYRAGADLRLGETGAYDQESDTWTFLPVGEHLDVPGVQAAARVLRTTGSARLGAQSETLTVLAVDAAQFAQVAHWRPDYADSPLSTLMTNLGHDYRGVLVDRRLLQAHALQPGDQIALSFQQGSVDFAVTGVVDLFPTLFPDDGRFVVVNLDYLFDYLGAQPHDVWLRLAPNVDAANVVAQLKERGIPIVRQEELRPALAEQKRDPTRLGALGVLSISFVIASLLTLLSLLLHSYVGFRRRLQQLGVLRAIGLSARQLSALFLAEQALLLALGVGGGAALGWAVGVVYAPFLQIRVTQHAGVPPFAVVVDWPSLAVQYLILIVFLALALPVNLWLLRRVAVHEAIKFGEERG